MTWNFFRGSRDGGGGHLWESMMEDGPSASLLASPPMFFSRRQIMFTIALLSGGLSLLVRHYRRSLLFFSLREPAICRYFLRPHAGGRDSRRGDPGDGATSPPQYAYVPFDSHKFLCCALYSPPGVIPWGPFLIQGLFSRGTSVFFSL